MKRLCYLLVLALLGAAAHLHAADPKPKDAAQSAEKSKPTATEKPKPDAHPPKPMKQKAPPKPKRVKHSKHLPSASSVPNRPETSGPDQFSKVPETKMGPATKAAKPSRKQP